MATKEALEAGDRLWKARVKLKMHISANGVSGETLRLIRSLERAAIRVGEVRERGRKKRGKGVRR